MEFLGIIWTEIFMRPMINSLALLYGLLFNNFGLSIIFFTVAIRLLMIPLTVRQTKSMQAMSAIQPKLKALQSRYKERKDAQSKSELSRETMGLYRNAGVNPIGCLGPMVLQIPIWIALYRAIFRTVPPTPEGLANLSNAMYSWNPSIGRIPFDSGFIGMDLVDLTQFAPVPFNFMMPVLVGATMWLQQKMTTVRTSDPRQQQTNQIMLWMMPIMFGFFTFQFPAGLAVYILFSNLVGIIIQYFVSGRQPIFRRFEPVPESAQAIVDPEPLTVEDEENNGTQTVFREDRRRSNRPRARDPRRKTRRRRDKRR